MKHHAQDKDHHHRFYIDCYFHIFTNPEGIVINSKGEVEGFVNKLREKVQRGKFWKTQLERANDKYKANLSPQQSLVSKMWRLNQEMLSTQNKINEAMKEVLTPEQFKAYLLREAADRIEKEGEYRIADEYTENKRLIAIRYCETIIPVIEAKLTGFESP